MHWQPNFLHRILKFSVTHDHHNPVPLTRRVLIAFFYEVGEVSEHAHSIFAFSASAFLFLQSFPNNQTVKTWRATRTPLPPRPHQPAGHQTKRKGTAQGPRSAGCAGTPGVSSGIRTSADLPEWPSRQPKSPLLRKSLLNLQHHLSKRPLHLEEVSGKILVGNQSH